MKEILKKILKIIIHILALVFFGVSSIFLFRNEKNTEPEKTAEEKKEVKENEVKNTDASELVDASPNQQDISTTVGGIKDEFRERVRNRFDSNLHR